MKLKFKAEAKDVMYFVLFSIFLLFLIAVGVGNITSLSKNGEFVGFNPLPGLSSENIFFVFVIIFLLFKFDELIVSLVVTVAAIHLLL